MNKKVLKVPGIEQKVKRFPLIFLLIWVFKTLIDSSPSMSGGNGGEIEQ